MLPAIPLGLQIAASIGIPVAKHYFAGRDEDKFRKKYGKQQAYNNLVSALSKGRIQPQNTVAPKRGTGSKIFSALGTGLSAYNPAQQLSAQMGQMADAGAESALRQQQLRDAAELRQGEALEVPDWRAQKKAEAAWSARAPEGGLGMIKPSSKSYGFGDAPVTAADTQGARWPTQVRSQVYNEANPAGRSVLGPEDPTDREWRLHGPGRAGFDAAVEADRMAGRVRREVTGGGLDVGAGELRSTAGVRTPRQAKAFRRDPYVVDSPMSAADRPKPTSAMQALGMSKARRARLKEIATTKREEGMLAVAEMNAQSNATRALYAGIADTRAGKIAARGVTTNNRAVIKDAIERTTPVIENYVRKNPDATYEEFAKGYDGLIPRDQHQALFETSQFNWKSGLSSDTSDYLRETVQSKLMANPDVKNSALIRGAMTNMYAAKDDAGGDITAYNAFAKIQDPNSVNRPSEITTVAQAQSFFQQIGLLTSGEKLARGRMATGAFREMLFKQAQEIYTRRANVIAHQLDTEYATLLPGMQHLQQERLQPYIDSFAMPELSLEAFGAVPVFDYTDQEVKAQKGKVHKSFGNFMDRFGYKTLSQADSTRANSTQAMDQWAARNWGG